MRPSDDHDHGTSGPTPASRHASVGVGGWLVICVLLVFLGAAIWFAVDIWQTTGDVEISMHGKIAMGLGIVVTIVLGAGLMALVFWSNRKGFDR